MLELDASTGAGWGVCDCEDVGFGTGSSDVDTSGRGVPCDTSFIPSAAQVGFELSRLGRLVRKQDLRHCFLVFDTCVSVSSLSDIGEQLEDETTGPRQSSSVAPISTSSSSGK